MKGNSESSYRTGNVNLTAANIGAVASSSFIFTRSKIVEFTVFSDGSGFELDFYSSNDKKNGVAVSFSTTNKVVFYTRSNGAYTERWRIN